MFTYASMWDIYEVKFLIFIGSIVIAVLFANYLYSKDKDND